MNADIAIGLIALLGFGSGFLVGKIAGRGDSGLLDDERRELVGGVEVIRLGRRRLRRIQYSAGAAIIALLFLLVLAAASISTARAQNAGATRIEFSLGRTFYKTHPGVWYDPLYPSQAETTPSSQTLSLRIPNWRASLVHLGTATVLATWGDHEYDDELNDPSLSRAPTTQGYGFGDIWGVQLGRTLERSTGALTFGAEGGLFLYRGEWDETFWRLDSPGAVGHDHTVNYNATPYASASVRGGIFYVEYGWYHHLQAGFINHDDRRLSLGVSVPFGGLQ